MVVRLHRLLHLSQLLFLGTDGGFNAFALRTGYIHFLGCYLHATCTLAFGGLACSGAFVLFSLNDSGTLVCLRIQNGVTNFADRLTAARLKTHTLCNLTHFFELHSLELL